jgi:hypothetical protein
MRIAESRLRRLIRSVICEEYEGTPEEDKHAKTIRLKLDHGIKFGKYKAEFIDSPDLFMILDKNSQSAIKEFMNVKMLAKPAELAKSEKKIEILKTAYEALMKIDNPVKANVVATYGSDLTAIITYSDLPNILACKPNGSYELFFSDRDDDDEWLWKDGDDAVYNLERTIEAIEDHLGGSINFKINVLSFLKRASLLHMVINLLDDAEAKQVMGEDSNSWFYNTSVSKPRVIAALLDSNEEMYSKSHSKVGIEPEGE